MNSVISPSQYAACLALVVAAAACGDDVPIANDDAPVADETATTVESERAEEQPVTPDATVETTTAPETAPSDTTPSDTTPSDSAVPETPVASDAITVAPEPTTSEPPAPSRADLVLRSNGVASADFGQEDIEVIPVATALIGGPVDDRLGEYPTFDDEYGTYVDFEDTGFSTPFGRTTCYDNEFCLYFGGFTSDDLRFVGWSQGSSEPASEPLVTADGVTIGSRYSDHLGVMTVDEGGCFSQGSGEVAGVQLFVTSEGVPFASVDDAGNFVSQTPDPAQIVVSSMQAGDQPFFLFADC